MSELPYGWAEASLSELVSVTRGITFAKAQRRDAPEEGFLPCLRTSNVQSELTTDRMAYVPVCCVKRADQFVAPGDLLISMSNSSELVGKVALATDVHSGFSFGAFLAALRSSAFEPKALWYLIKSWRVQQELRETASQTTNIANISATGMAEIRLPLPPIAEQRRIVAKLDTLTARTARARADLDRIPALAARYKQAVLAKAFSGELTAAWRAANGVVEATWPRSDVGSLTTDVRYGTATRCAFSPSETPVLRIPNIAKGRIDTTDLKHASFDEKERAKLALKAGDVLVIRSNGSLHLVGRAAVATDEVAGFIYAGYLIRLRLNMERVSPEFLQLAFEEPSIRALIEGFAKSTSGVNNINSEQLKSLMFPLPSLVEQSEIVRRVDASFAEIDRLTAEAAAARRLLDRLDQAILAKAFRGELVPQDPADESASVLLERIRAERAAAPKPSRGRRKAAAA